MNSMLCQEIPSSYYQSSVIVVSQIKSEMAIFKITLTLVVLFCLVTDGLGMSVAGKNVDEDSALARFFRGLDKRTMFFIRISE